MMTDLKATALSKVSSMLQKQEANQSRTTAKKASVKNSSVKQSPLRKMPTSVQRSKPHTDLLGEQDTSIDQALSNGDINVSEDDLNNAPSNDDSRSFEPIDIVL